MSAGSHGVSVDLRLDVGVGDGVGLEPRDVDLDVEVSDARGKEGSEDISRSAFRFISPACLRFHPLLLLSHEEDDCTHLETMASSGMTEKCSPRMMSRFPVVVTKTLALGAASSMVTTS